MAFCFARNMSVFKAGCWIRLISSKFKINSSAFGSTARACLEIILSVYQLSFIQKRLRYNRRKFLHFLLLIKIVLSTIDIFGYCNLCLNSFSNYVFLKIFEDFWDFIITVNWLFLLRLNNVSDIGLVNEFSQPEMKFRIPNWPKSLNTEYIFNLFSFPLKWVFIIRHDHLWFPVDILFYWRMRLLTSDKLSIIGRHCYYKYTGCTENRNPVHKI